MAVRKDLKHYMSRSDEDILNAFAQFHDLRTEVLISSVSDTKSSDYCSISLSNCSNSTESATTVSPKSKLLCNNEAYKYKNPSFNRNCKSETCDSTITETFENLSIISKMFDTLGEHKEFWQTKYHSSQQKVVEDAECIVSVSKLSERLQRIAVVISHLREVSEKYRTLKQVLRSCDQTDSLKSHIQYHRYILNFFDIAYTILKDVSKDSVVLENSSHASHREVSYSEFSKKVLVLTTEIHKSMDRLKEFEGYVQSPDLNMFS